MRLMAVGITLLMLVGCDDHSSSTNSSPASGPTTQVAAEIKTTQPATRPASELIIDEKSVVFPAAKIVLRKKTGELNAILCTDDPPAAINPSYTGNSYMFEMTLDIEDPADLPSAAWTYHAPKPIPQDSNVGIYLNGSRRQLQPLDVKITFAKAGEDIVATINGTFLLFDSHESSSTMQTVNVSGKLDAVVSER